MAGVCVLGVIVDLRKLDDDDVVGFVRRRLEEPYAEIADVVERLQVLGKAWPQLGVDMLVSHQRFRRLIRVRDGFVTNQSPSVAEPLAAELLRRRQYFRLPPNGYTQERLDEVTALAARRDPEAVPKLIEYLRYSTSGAALEQELRWAIFDALSWHETDEVRAVLLEALRSESDEIADPLVQVMARQSELIPELPDRIDAAWKARDERLARRLLAALVKADDRGAYKGWVLANYRLLYERTSIRYP